MTNKSRFEIRRRPPEPRGCGAFRVALATATLCSLFGGLSPAASAPGYVRRIAGGAGRAPVPETAMRPSAMLLRAGRLVVLDELGAIRDIDPVSGLQAEPIEELWGGPNLAADAAGNLYVVGWRTRLEGNSAVWRVDAITRTVSQVYSFPEGRFGGCGLAANDDSLFFCERDASTPVAAIYRYDLVAHEIEMFLPPGGVPGALAVDGAGDLLVAVDCRILRVARSGGTVSELAGGPPIDGVGHCGFSGDGGPALGAGLRAEALATNGAGDVFFGNRNDFAAASCVRVVRASSHEVWPVAGDCNDAPDYGVDGGGPLAEAKFGRIRALAVASDGTVFIGEFEFEGLYRILPGAGTVDRWNASFWGLPALGDGHPGNEAQLYNANAVAVDSDGSVFVADLFRVRKVDAATGIIETWAGSDAQGYSGDGGPARQARLQFPTGLELDGMGNLLISDVHPAGFGVVRRVDAKTGRIETWAGSPDAIASGDGGPASAARLVYPAGLAVDPQGNVYVADLEACRVRRIDAASGVITTVAGRAPVVPDRPQSACGSLGGTVDTSDPTAFALSGPRAVATDASGNLLIADTGVVGGISSGVLRRIDFATNTITTLSRLYTGLRSVRVDPLGRILIAHGNVVERLDEQSQTSSRVLGSGMPSDTFGDEDGKPALQVDVTASSMALAATPSGARLVVAFANAVSRSRVLAVDAQYSSGLAGGPGQLAPVTITAPETPVSITIPPGALAQETRISLANGLNPSGFDLGSDFPSSLVVQFAPAGLEFLLPVTITLPWSDENGDGLIDGYLPPVSEADTRVWHNGAAITGRCADSRHVPGTCTDACCDRVAKRWTIQADSFSDYATGKSSCATLGGAQVSLAGLETPGSDDKYSVKGTAILDAASVAALNPVRGLKAVIYADGGVGLVIEIPPSDPGWKSNSKGTKFAFDSRKSPNVDVPFQMSIGLNASAKKPSVQVAIKGTGHSFGGARPKVSARLTFGNGTCLEAIFAGPAGSGCSVGGGRIRCK